MLLTLLSVCSKLFTVCVRRFLKYSYVKYLGINHNLVIIIASTTSFSWISVLSVLLGGRSNSALAVFTLSNRLLIWFPVLFATGTGESGSHDNTTR